MIPPPGRAREALSRLRTRVREATSRERLMLAGLSAVGAGLLLSLGIRLTRDAIAEHREISARRARADILLANAPDVEKTLVAKSESIAVPRTGAAEVLAALETLARECAVTTVAGSPETKPAGKLLLHRVSLSVRADSLRKLMDFDTRLHASRLAVERLDIIASDDSGNLSATYGLVSCQLSE